MAEQKVSQVERQTNCTVHVNTSQSESCPQTFSPHFQAADDLRPVEYALPYVSTRFTDPQENKVTPDKIVQGGISMQLHANSCGNNPLSVVMD